jgi:hypothetical protein
MMNPTTIPDMAYEVLVRSWRPMSPIELRGAIKELCAADLAPTAIEAALEQDERFTTSEPGRFGLYEFAERTPGQFSIG